MINKNLCTLWEECVWLKFGDCLSYAQFCVVREQARA